MGVLWCVHHSDCQMLHDWQQCSNSIGTPGSNDDLSMNGRDAGKARDSEHEVFRFVIQNQPKSLVVTRSVRLPSVGVLGLGGVPGLAAFGADGTRFTHVSAPMLCAGGAYGNRCQQYFNEAVRFTILHHSRHDDSRRPAALSRCICDRQIKYIGNCAISASSKHQPVFTGHLRLALGRQKHGGLPTTPLRR